MSVKEKIAFFCQSCGAEYSKWIGQCKNCLSWNALSERKVLQSSQHHYAGECSKIYKLSDVDVISSERIRTGLTEFDRVVGGGLIPGSVILLGGDPGIGKSTLLSQCISNLSEHVPTLYISGEESLQQISLRAKRLKLSSNKMHVLAETCVEKILSHIEKNNHVVVVVDSVQTIFTETINAAPGGVSQIRESAAKLIQYAKRKNIVLFLVGHVTKEGVLAGPRVLEHMVDTVLYFEGSKNNRFRMIRAVKNRYGQINELGVFVMTSMGLKTVSNPSAIFLSRSDIKNPGSVVTVTWEGTRPMLLEVQSLVDDSQLPQPRRLSVGIEQSRLTLLLAVMHKYVKVKTFNKDIFINIVGGIRINETAADLAVVLAILSSLENKSVPNDLCVLGEVGLTGELRPVPYGIERLKEIEKHGFKSVILPKLNLAKQDEVNLQLYPVEEIGAAIRCLNGLMV